MYEEITFIGLTTPNTNGTTDFLYERRIYCGYAMCLELCHLEDEIIIVDH